MSARHVPRVLLRILPKGSIVGDDYLSHSGRTFVRRVPVFLASLAFLAWAISLLQPGSWSDVLAGAVLAWSVSLLFWSFSSFKNNKELMTSRLEEAAKLDLLHARLNLISEALGVQGINLDYELDDAWRYRQARLAHLTGLEEFGPEGYEGSSGSEFWSEKARGIHESE